MPRGPLHRVSYTWEVMSLTSCELLAVPVAWQGLLAALSLRSPRGPAQLSPKASPHGGCAALAMLASHGPVEAEPGQCGCRLQPGGPRPAPAAVLPSKPVCRLHPQSCLEFSLRIQEFIELIRQNKRLDAVR